MNETVLILRDAARNAPALCAPTTFSRPRLRFARNVMEVKAHLLRCLNRVEAGLFALPGFVLVDTANGVDVKQELNRWLGEHPRLAGVQVLLAAELSWMTRSWNTLGRLLRLW